MNYYLIYVINFQYIVLFMHLNKILTSNIEIINHLNNEITIQTSSKTTEPITASIKINSTTKTQELLFLIIQRFHH